MFERFTDGARLVVQTAQEEARALAHGFIGTEHLLLGLLGVEDGVAATVLIQAGLTETDIREEISRRVGSGRFGHGSEADALRVIGIDVDAVREEVEKSFGPGALDRPRMERRRRWRRRRCTVASPHLSLSPRAKKVLELSLREALALRHGYIGTEHILLALLREGEGLAARILADRDLRFDDLRQQVLRALGRVA